MAVEDAISQAKSRIESLLEPIEGGVGIDVTYDESFEKLKGEVDKMGSISGGKVDWGSLVSGADEILSEKSKDFRIALFYAAAKSYTDGITGALDGLVVVQELSAKYWDTMYPALRRPKARGNLCSWYGDIAAAAIGGYTPVAKDADVIGAIDQVSRAVDADLRDKLGDSYTGISALRNTVRNLLQIVPKEAPPPPPPPPPKPAPEPTSATAQAAVASSAQTTVVVQAPAGPSGPTLASIVDAESATAVMGECALLLARAGDTLRAGDPKGPAGYRVLRTGLWLEVAQEPFSPNGDGQTLLEAPPEHVRGTLAGLLAAGSFAEILPVADEYAANYPFWLDPHRFASAALDNLGEEYEAAKRAVLVEIGTLLVRAPGLPEMRFGDGMPFADDETKAWIQAEVKAILGGGGGAPAGPARPRSYTDKPVAEARKLLGEERPADAIAALMKAAAAAPTPLDAFKTRLALAQICIEIQQIPIARAQLEGLEKIVEQHGLTAWQPDLCAEVYGALYTCLKAMNQGYEVPPEARAKEMLAFERLCQLDAAAAFRMSIG